MSTLFACSAAVKATARHRCATSVDPSRPTMASSSWETHVWSARWLFRERRTTSRLTRTLRIELQQLDRVRHAIRTKHYSRRTESAYVDWIRRYIVFHRKRHPSEMGATEIASFLTWLATHRRVSASTQNQALSAVLFLYRDVLHVAIRPIEHVPRARMPVRVRWS